MILIVAEMASGKMSKSTLEMVAAARQMGREGGVPAGGGDNAAGIE